MHLTLERLYQRVFILIHGMFIDGNFNLNIAKIWCHMFSQALRFSTHNGFKTFSHKKIRILFLRKNIEIDIRLA